MSNDISIVQIHTVGRLITNKITNKTHLKYTAATGGARKIRTKHHPYTWVSSAYRWGWRRWSAVSGARSAVYITNNNGPRTKPCEADGLLTVGKVWRYYYPWTRFTSMPSFSSKVSSKFAKQPTILRRRWNRETWQRGTTLNWSQPVEHPSAQEKIEHDER